MSSQYFSIFWRRGSLAIISLLTLPASSQTQNTVFAAGYVFPVSPYVAGGEIVSLFVQGVGDRLTGPVVATSLPLPTVLAGISVTLSSLLAPSSVAVPIVSVVPVRTCLNPPDPLASTCSKYVAVRIQLPENLPRNAPDSSETSLVVAENGVAGGRFDMSVAPDAVHVVAITHGDGTSASLQAPARVGEELVIWAYGLGTTTPSVPAGQASPTPAAATQNVFRLNFDYRPNSPPYGTLMMPAACATMPTCPQVQPLFSGLTPGYAGLYQVNFVVPAPLPGTAACTNNSAFPYYPYTVSSNLTVSLIGSSSFDGLGICVDPLTSSGSANIARGASAPGTQRHITVPPSIVLAHGVPVSSKD